MLYEVITIEIRRSVREPTRLDRVVIVDEEQEDIPVRGVERRRIAADLDIGVVDSGRPVEHAGHLPARIARSIARDALHGLDEFMISYNFV